MGQRLSTGPPVVLVRLVALRCKRLLIFRFPHDFENRIARHIPFLTMRRGSSGVSKMAVPN